MRISAKRKAAVITDYWLDHYCGDHCTLCGNSGTIDTVGVRTAAGVHAGRLNWCICPNGQVMRKMSGMTAEQARAAQAIITQVAREYGPPILSALKELTELRKDMARVISLGPIPFQPPVPEFMAAVNVAAQRHGCEAPYSRERDFAREYEGSFGPPKRCPYLFAGGHACVLPDGHERRGLDHDCGSP